MLEDDFDDLKPGDMSRLSIPWYQKLLLKISPKLFMRMWAKKMDIDYDKVDCAEKIFRDERVDIQPFSGVGGRGFIVFVGNKLSFHFYQDGDHFVYDGHEMGEYENGDITVFDGLEKR